MIDIEKVTKIYKENAGNFKVSFKVDDGLVYGLVGPNGSGKTTLLSQIMGFIKPDSGKISINSLDSWLNREDLMDNIGYVPGEIKLFEYMTGMEYIKASAKFKSNVDFEFVEELIRYFDVDVNTKIKKMSKGMKQKIAIIESLISKPSLLIFDEPSSGLDPIMQKQFIDLINFIKKEFKPSIIISSHIMDELITLTDKIGFLKNGTLIDEIIVKERDIDVIKKKFEELYNKKGFFNEKK